MQYLVSKGAGNPPDSIPLARLLFAYCIVSQGELEGMVALDTQHHCYHVHATNSWLWLVLLRRDPLVSYPDPSVRTPSTSLSVVWNAIEI